MAKNKYKNEIPCDFLDDIKDDIAALFYEVLNGNYKVNPEYIELKTKRVQLILQPSLYSKVKATAQAKNLSVNEFCHRVLEDATKGE